MTHAIVGAYEATYERHPPPGRTTAELLREAVVGAVADAGLTMGQIDGLGVSSFTLGPDHVIDLAWRLGLSPRWLMQDPLGGASGINLLQHAVRAVEAGDASTIVLVAGDRFDRARFAAVSDDYNVATRDHVAPLRFGGPNAAFAMLTQRHSALTGLDERDYAQIPVTQRAWSADNPRAVYRTPLTVEEYLAAPVVWDPLRRFDCVPIVAGADALVITAAPGTRSVRVRALEALHNVDNQDGAGISGGHSRLAPTLWERAGLGPSDVDVIGVYDDYPVMVLAQLVELGFAPDGDVARLVHNGIASRRLAVNTSGGQLSAGQAGAAGGMHFLVEAVDQLRGRRHGVPGARTALVSGYGMVLYRYGACANAVVLEAMP